MKKVLLTILLILLVSPCWAADWYVRPAGGVYGPPEDGSDYDHAWDGLLNVVWGEGGVEAGDTLYVCGLHLYDAPVYPGNTGCDINIVTGTGEDTRIVIRGDYPGDPGIVWGGHIPTYAVNDTGWEQQGAPNTNVYKLALIGSAAGDWVFRDVTPGDPDGVLLDWEYDADVPTAIALVQANEDSSFWDSANAHLYVHVQGGGEPAPGTIVINKYGYDFKMADMSYITFYKLTFYAPYRMFSYSTGSFTGTHITWEGCTLLYGEGGGIIQPGLNCHYMNVIDCEIGYAGNGLYWTAGSSNLAASHYIIRGNYIHDIGCDARTAGGDGHAIGIQGGHDGLIEDNYCINTGMVILLYTYGSQSLTDTIIRYNTVINPHALGNQYGISLQMSTDSIAVKTGIEIYANRIINCDPGIRITQLRDEVKVYNNIMRDCGTSLYVAGEATVLDITNGTDAIIKGADLVGTESGATARVQDTSQLTGSAPNRTGTMSVDLETGDFQVGEDIIIDGAPGVIVAVASSAFHYLGVNVNFKNNISVNPTNLHIYFDVGPQGEQGVLTSNYNCFHPDCDIAEDCFQDVRGDDALVDFAKWQITSFSPDANSNTTDPDLGTNDVPGVWMTGTADVGDIELIAPLTNHWPAESNDNVIVTFPWKMFGDAPSMGVFNHANPNRFGATIQ